MDTIESHIVTEQDAKHLASKANCNFHQFRLWDVRVGYIVGADFCELTQSLNELLMMACRRTRTSVTKNLLFDEIMITIKQIEHDINQLAKM